MASPTPPPTHADAKGAVWARCPSCGDLYLVTITVTVLVTGGPPTAGDPKLSWDHRC